MPAHDRTMPATPLTLGVVLALLLSVLTLVPSAGDAHAASSKAGVASSRYASEDPGKLVALNATWTYNWSTTAATQPPGMEFVPMLHRTEFVTDAAISALTQGRAEGRYRHLLGFNEPDLAGQADMSVAEALDLWPRLESTGLRLGSPAPSWPGAWLDQFMAGATQRGLRVDFVALHFYQDFTRPTAVAELRRTLEDVHARYGKPIWVTELGAMDIRQWGLPMSAEPTQAAADAYIAEVVAMLESLPFVERYAWFIDCCSSTDLTSLYDSSGRLTSHGAAFQAATGGVPAAERDRVRAYVTAVYADLLGRAPDPVGLDHWSGALHGGTPYGEVANGITYSTEFRSGLVRSSYQRYLGREPDEGGLQGWLAAMGAGMQIGQMEAGFIASPEFYLRSGSDDRTWVVDLYRTVLDRTPAGNEVDDWVQRLRTGATRSAVAGGFLSSTEHLTTVVDQYYVLLLDRHIDPSGASSWVTAIQGGHRIEEIIAGIVASQEYRNTH